MKPLIQICVILLLPILLFCQNVPDSIIVKSNKKCAKGVTKFSIGYKNDALECFNEAIELNSKHDKAYFWRGKLKQSIGDYEGALNDYKTAIFLNPNETLYYTTRAFFLESQLGDYKGSLL
ncbi:MAG: hypothetical protein IPH57_10035 [Saprospiraceae bacterium]|nr:hypothetical protein [Saprospiraceae bacterium]